MFLSGEKSRLPGVLVFLSVLPSQACDRGSWVRCNVWAVSRESFTPAQPLTSHPPEEASVSFLLSKAQEAPPSRRALVARVSPSRPLGYLSEIHLYPQCCVGIK